LLITGLAHCQFLLTHFRILGFDCGPLACKGSSIFEII
jgi:hypothetical protein